MGIQDALSQYSVNWKRRIRDYAVSNTGFEGEVIRISSVGDIYGDEEITVISSERILVALEIPSDLPLTRLRKNVVTAPTEATTDNVFMYDILPIKGRARFQDNVEKGDLLIHKIYDERKDTVDTYLWVLRVSEVLGNISVRHITNRYFHCAPYNGALPQEVQDIIDAYEDLTDGGL